MEMGNDASTTTAYEYFKNYFNYCGKTHDILIKLKNDVELSTE